MPVLVGVQGVAQTYAWGVKGSHSLVAATAQQTDDFFPVDNATPYAELWFGSHPSAPSTALLPDGSQVPLPEWLKGQKLPYLFKVLAIAQPLSLQLHPDEESAAKLHAEDPAHYRDPHSKPEAAIALSDPAEAFCGFRRVKDILMLAHSIGPFGRIVFGDAAEANPATDTAESESQILATMMKNLYSFSKTEIDGLVEETLTIDPATAQPVVKKDPTVFGSALRTLKSIFRDDILSPADLLKLTLTLFRRLHETFPYDRGLFAAFFLNYVRMRPGDVVALAPNTIHAYIAGNMLEVMKTSDNVVRAGLTPKFQDVERLLALTTYKSLSVSGSMIKPQEVGKFIKAYVPQITDSFRFYTIHVGPGAYLKDARIPDWSPMLVFVLRGQCEIIGSQVITNSAGNKEDTIEEHRKLKAGQACMLEQAMCLGVRNLTTSSTSSAAKRASPFHVSDFGAAAAEPDCDLLVVISNQDPAVLKRTVRLPSKMVIEPLSSSPAPPSVAEFPVVTPLEQAAYDFPDDNTQSINNQVTDVTANNQVTDVTANNQVADVTANSQVTDVTANNQVADVTANSQVTDVTANNQVTDVTANSQVGDVVSNNQVVDKDANDPITDGQITDKVINKVIDQVSGGDEIVGAAVETKTNSISEDEAHVELTQTVTEQAHTVTEVDDNDVTTETNRAQSPERVRSPETQVVSEPNDGASTAAEETELPKPRRPAATANEIAEVKIARTLAKKKGD